MVVLVKVDTTFHHLPPLVHKTIYPIIIWHHNDIIHIVLLLVLSFSHIRLCLLNKTSFLHISFPIADNRAFYTMEWQNLSTWEKEGGERKRERKKEEREREKKGKNKRDKECLINEHYIFSNFSLISSSVISAVMIHLFFTSLSSLPDSSPASLA